ncbi:MAG: DMT family transporter [Candidatus Komeilibacteria bacterium]|nr:DMT family transporter [Candidatus Komeilibacteria bacterium]
MSFTLLALGSAIFASIANILARALLKNLKSRDILGINFLTMGVTLLLLSPWFYYFKITLLSFGLLVLISFIDCLANYFYFKIFEKNEASIATPILSLAPAFTFLFAWLIINDVVSWEKYIISLAIIILVVLFSADFSFKSFKFKSLLPGLISSALFGLSAIPSKYLLSSGVINAPTLYMFRAGLIALFALLFFRFPLNSLTTGQYQTIFFRGLFVITQWVLLYYALTLGNSGVTLTLSNTTPIFVFILGAIFLQEKITYKKIIAALLILIFSLII